jgi:hypothetical protein
VAATFALFLTRVPTTAQTMIGAGKLAVLPGRALEDSFGLAAVVLIVIIYRIRPAEAELRAWSLPSGWERGAPPGYARQTLPQSAAGPAGGAEQLPSGAG